MKPYYEKDGVTIYHGDCREIVPSLPRPGLVIADPPYGISQPCDFKARGRGTLGSCIDYPNIFGDTEPFDPSLILSLDVPACLWGANYYADRLPNTSGWLVWDKRTRNDKGSNDQADGELAWTNFCRGVRIFRHMWNGMWRDSESGTKYHPTQKPVELFNWILSLKWTPREGLILDPFCGSGPVLLAARRANRKAIGIEIEERYCEIAAKRLSQTVMNFDDSPQDRIRQATLKGLERHGQ